MFSNPNGGGGDIISLFEELNELVVSISYPGDGYGEDSIASAYQMTLPGNIYINGGAGAILRYHEFKTKTIYTSAANIVWNTFQEIPNGVLIGSSSNISNAGLVFYDIEADEARKVIDSGSLCTYFSPLKNGCLIGSSSTNETQRGLWYFDYSTKEATLLARHREMLNFFPLLDGCIITSKVYGSGTFNSEFGYWFFNEADGVLTKMFTIPDGGNMYSMDQIIKIPNGCILSSLSPFGSINYFDRTTMSNKTISGYGYISTLLYHDNDIYIGTDKTQASFPLQGIIKVNGGTKEFTKLIANGAYDQSQEIQGVGCLFGARNTYNVQFLDYNTGAISQLSSAGSGYNIFGLIAGGCLIGRVGAMGYVLFFDSSTKLVSSIPGSNGNWHSFISINNGCIGLSADSLVIPPVGVQTVVFFDNATRNMTTVMMLPVSTLRPSIVSGGFMLGPTKFFNTTTKALTTITIPSVPETTPWGKVVQLDNGLHLHLATGASHYQGYMCVVDPMTREVVANFPHAMGSTNLYDLSGNYSRIYKIDADTYIAIVGSSMVLVDCIKRRIVAIRSLSTPFYASNWRFLKIGSDVLFCNNGFYSGDLTGNKINDIYFENIDVHWYRAKTRDVVLLSRAIQTMASGTATFNRNGFLPYNSMANLPTYDNPNK